jgi:gamma-glutamyl hercynylcysteine S-oxide synthase
MILQDRAPEELAYARAATDKVFALVQPDCLFDRPIPLRHRLIFYLGHVEAFDWNLTVEHGVASKRPDPKLDRLFAFGIDPAPGQPPSDRPSDWPELSKVRDYCETTRAAVDEFWSALPSQLRQTCREHRLMHAETIAYMLHNMEHHKLVRQSSKEPEIGTPGAGGRVPIPEGLATLGMRSGEGFGWDNEFEQHHVPVESFSIDRYKVTNGEYLAFVEAGAAPPHYWLREHGSWYLRRTFDVVPLPLDWPVWVTHQEAANYAGWTGGCLPSEAQWHRAAYGTTESAERDYPWGDSSPIAGVHGAFGLDRWDPCPPSAYPLGASAFGVHDLIGNGWEWTSTPFGPFRGFSPFPFYPGYSADFFDGEHYVLKGASPCTPTKFLRRSFRNWFRTDYPYVFAGFRCAYNHQ